MQTEYMIVLAYLVVINTIGFILCKIDKTRAKKHQWRIAEKNFFIISTLGGAVGTYLGLRCFRHKTKHWYFMIGIPVIFIIQLMLLIYVLYYSKVLLP